MCSRYYIDPGMTEDISRVVQNIDGRIWLAQGDTRPTDVAPVIGQSEHGLELPLCCTWQGSVTGLIIAKCLYFCRLSLNFCDFIFALVKVFKTSKSVFRPCFHINPVVQYVYKHKGGFDYHEEKKVFQITILNADYHDYCYVLPASPSSFR